MVNTGDKCNVCGFGYILPSLYCDHCNIYHGVAPSVVAGVEEKLWTTRIVDGNNRIYEGETHLASFDPNTEWALVSLLLAAHNASLGEPRGELAATHVRQNYRCVNSLELVAEFHRHFQQSILDTPDLNRGAINSLRVRLIQEELDELSEALELRNPVQVLDALTDIQYVLDGAYLSLGFHPWKDTALLEVHRSNMSKLGSDGKPILRADGKIIKSNQYSRADLEKVLSSQSGNSPATSVSSPEEQQFNCEPKSTQTDAPFSSPVSSVEREPESRLVANIRILIDNYENPPPETSVYVPRENFANTLRTLLMSSGLPWVSSVERDAQQDLEEQ